MGRIADALQRAHETQPEGGTRTAPPRLGGATSPSRWYRIASADRIVHRTPAAAPPPDAPPVEGMSPEIVTYYDRSSAISEQYRSLRTRLLSANPRQDHHVYAVASAVPREGKTITTVNLAFSLAEIRHLRILIVDGDFRRRTLAGVLNTDAEPGMADLLQNEASYDQIIRPTAVPNLFFAPAGRTRGRPAPELLSTHAARATFRRFERDFHYTLVDTPPASSVADVGVIGQMTTGAIFVVRMHRTPEPLARRAIKLLRGNNVPIIGGLVIGEDDPSTGYGRARHYPPPDEYDRE